MASLLTQGERDAIRSELRNVTDTFYTTPIKIDIRTSGLMQKFGEGATTITSYNLFCYPKYSDGTNITSINGVTENFDISVSLNILDVIAAGLISTTEIFTISTTNTTFWIAESEYNLIDYITSGHFEPKGILVKLIGKKAIKK